MGRWGFGGFQPIALNRSLISVPGGVQRNLESRMVSGSDDSGLGAGARAGEFLTKASFLAGDIQPPDDNASRKRLEPRSGDKKEKGRQGYHLPLKTP